MRERARRNTCKPNSQALGLLLAASPVVPTQANGQTRRGL